MESQEKKVYEPPQLNVVTVKAERGYAESLRYIWFVPWMNAEPRQVDVLNDYTTDIGDIQTW